MRVLFIAYYFPPESSSGAFRPLYFANHLQEMGHDITILTVNQEDFTAEQPIDPELLLHVNPAVEVCRCRALHLRESILKWKRYLSLRRTTEKKEESDDAEKPIRTIENTPAYKKLFYYLLSFPDECIGWLPFAVIKGYKIIKQKDVDIILATGGPWTSFVVARFLKLLSRKKVIYDYRDPWGSNPVRKYNFTWLRKLEDRLEAWVLKKADSVVANTEELAVDFRERFPFLKEEQVSTITNGYEHLQAKCLPTANCLTILHAGELYQQRTPLYFLQGVLAALQENKDLQEELCIQLLGGVQITSDELRKVMADPLMQKVLQVIPRLPLKQAVKKQQECDVLLLIQPGYPLQVPRKLYEYLAFQKIILAVTDSDGATANIIRKHNLGLTVSNNMEDVKNSVLDIYNKWKTGELKSPAQKDYELFLNSNLTKKLAAQLEKQNIVKK